MRITPTTTSIGLFFVLSAACGGGADNGPCEDADLAPDICSAIYDSSTGDSKADELSRLRGIVIERTGDRTYFKIPVAYTVGGDRRKLLDKTMHAFTAEVSHVGDEMEARGVDLDLLMDFARGDAFEASYRRTLDGLFNTDVNGEIEVGLGEFVAEPRQLWSWQRYVVPQAFVAYFGTKFSANLGIGGGVSATILISVQPWLSLAVENVEMEPTVVEKTYEVDVAVLGIPNVDVGFGIGGGFPIRIGAGAVFGPLDDPADLAGWGVGLSGSFNLPLAGGGQAKFVTVLRDPPLFLALAGYNTGTAASAEIHGNLQYLMNLDEFLRWIGASH